LLINKNSPVSAILAPLLFSYTTLFILFRIPTIDPCLESNDQNIFELGLNGETGLEEEESIAEEEYEEELPWRIKKKPLYQSKLKRSTWVLSRNHRKSGLL
jgi:hypothetical protein